MKDRADSEKAKRRGRQARFVRRYSLFIVGPVLLCTPPLLIVLWTGEPRLRLVAVSAALALLPPWLLELRDRTVRRDRPQPRMGGTRLWLAVFAAIIGAIYLPVIVANYLALERTRACYATAETWLLHSRGNGARHWAVRCQSPITP